MTSIKITNQEIEYNANEKQSLISTDIGTIFMYAGTTMDNISNNFLLCDGASYNRIEYADLFNIIQTTYGSNNNTTFNVPNLKYRIPIGPNTGVNTINYRGSNTINGGNNSIESSQFKHTHSIPTTTYVRDTQSSNVTVTWSTNNAYVFRNYSHAGAVTTSNNTNDSQKEHFPKYTALNYIICYKT